MMNFVGRERRKIEIGWFGGTVGECPVNEMNECE